MEPAFARMIASVALPLLFVAAEGAAQDAPPTPTGWELAGVPALNYDADEGFGYGAIVELYNYGAGGLAPYRFTVQPTIFLTTGGRRDLTLFFDAPHLLPGTWRINAFVGTERQVASPYYGPGNDAPFDPTADEGDNPYYYRFGRTRRRLEVNFQRSIGDSPLRFLLGTGMARVTIDPTPYDEGTTLLARDMTAVDRAAAWSNHVRAGIVWDTRDREVGPSRGAWSEILLQRVAEALGSRSGYTRWTAIDRRYVPIAPGLTFANRFILQGVVGDAPFYDLYLVQTSFGQPEGLGGADTLRGIPKNRYVGKGIFLWNSELRWRAGGFEAIGRRFHVVVSAFVDSGRVWEDAIGPRELLSDLHHGFGGGVRLGMGENFVVALDVGHSSEATAPIYVGLGYLY